MAGGDTVAGVPAAGTTAIMVTDTVDTADTVTVDTAITKSLGGRYRFR